MFPRTAGAEGQAAVAGALPVADLQRVGLELMRNEQELRCRLQLLQTKRDVLEQEVAHLQQQQQVWAPSHQRGKAKNIHETALFNALNATDGRCVTQFGPLRQRRGIANVHLFACSWHICGMCSLGLMSHPPHGAHSERTLPQGPRTRRCVYALFALQVASTGAIELHLAQNPRHQQLLKEVSQMEWAVMEAHAHMRQVLNST